MLAGDKVRVRLEVWLRFQGDMGRLHVLPNGCAVLEEYVAKGTTVEAFFSQLSEQSKFVREKIFCSGKFSPDVLITINEQLVPFPDLCGRALNDGDKIMVVPVFSGG